MVKLQRFTCWKFYSSLLYYFKKVSQVARCISCKNVTSIVGGNFAVGSCAHVEWKADRWWRPRCLNYMAVHLCVKRCIGYHSFRASSNIPFRKKYTTLKSERIAIFCLTLQNLAHTISNISSALCRLKILLFCRHAVERCKQEAQLNISDNSIYGILPSTLSVYFCLAAVFQSLKAVYWVNIFDKHWMKYEQRRCVSNTLIIIPGACYKSQYMLN